MEQETPFDPVNPVADKYRYAATYGLYLGLYLAVFYLLGVIFPDFGLARTVSSLGHFFGLVVAWMFVKKYRDEICGGYARFSWLWNFSFWLAVFAALIMAAVQFIHFQWLQPDYLNDSFNQTLSLLQSANCPEEQLDQLAGLSMPSAIEATFICLWCEIIGGAFLAFFYALFLHRRKR